MRIDVITLFPEMLKAVTEWGITGRAYRRGLLQLYCWNPRDATHDRHRTVDDRPYGGGPGMVMKYQPLRDTVARIRAEAAQVGKLVYLSPQGRPLDQRALEGFAQQPQLLLLCGRYEGLDERFIEAHVDEEWSLGDYVISGGELAAMVIIDGIARLLPDALGDPESAQRESFSSGLLDYPHYTRPEAIDGRTVPEVLLSGNHRAIESWRQQQALGRTWLRRPELLQQQALTGEQLALLEAFIAQHRDEC